MAASSRTRSSGPALSNSFNRSISPSGRLYSGDVSTFASSSAASFSARSPTFLQRSASPTRVSLVGPAQAVRLSFDRLTSIGGTFSSADQVVKKPIASPPAARRKTCMCSPTTHPGSFRCGFHKRLQAQHHGRGHAASSPSHRLNARRSAMTNSLVRIGTVEGEWVKRALAALIRPCAHQQRRRADFRPRQSRLSVMSKADDL